MGNKDLSGTEKILVKVDQNNLIYVDPNSVIRDGAVEPRNIDQEKLVMYVNLEADLVPRSYLLSDTTQTRYQSIVNRTFNLLTPQNGTDLNTDWSESYNPEPREGENKTFVFDKKDFNDTSGQAFGVESINIAIKGANFIPQISMNFIDVRGKTLFEQPNDSPYNTFFHLPWPIFYLTIKGYYGKALRYRLHLISFSSKYNESNGNFEISTKFIGSTYAYLNDIPLNGIINAPYLYSNARVENKKFNEQKGVYEQVIKRSSKGYMMLTSVYAEMKQKKIIPEDFPVLTLRELEIMAMSLDKILEKTIFDQVIDPKILGQIEIYNKTLNDFVKTIEGWIDKNLIPVSYGTYNNEPYFFFLEKKNAKSKILVVGKDTPGTLDFILSKYNTELNKIAQQINTIEIASKDISGVRIKTNLPIMSTKSGDDYCRQAENTDQGNDLQYGINRNQLISDIYKIQGLFYEESSKVMKQLEKNVNTIIKDKKKGGLGFDPTIRNIFAVLMANAEVYVRMTKDVHERAFNAGNERKKLVQPFDKETKKGDSIYPWPEIRKEIPGNRTQIIAYPGDLELRNKLQSYDKNKWPEVEFIEQYIKFTTKVTGVEKIDYLFSDNDEVKVLKNVSTIFDALNTIPYTNRTVSSFLYEIFERAKQMTLVESFNSLSWDDIANIEFENIKKSLETEIDLVSELKKIGTNSNPINELLRLMSVSSPYERYPYYLDSIPTTKYINDTLSQPFNIIKYDPSETKKIDISGYDNLLENLKNYKPERYRRSLYPFSSDTYLGYINKTDYSLNNFNFNNIFEIETEGGIISTPLNTDLWINQQDKNNLFTQKLTVENNYTSILNTPYFHNQLYSDFNEDRTFGRFTGSAYLLLNSLPFKDLDDSIGTSGLKMATMFKEVGATHYVPYFLILKWGSIYHRYKQQIQGKDILSGCTTSNITKSIPGQQFFDGNESLTFTISGKTPGIDVTYSGNTDMGLHPFYDAIYHQIINGYTHYDLTDPVNSYNSKVTDNPTSVTGKSINNISSVVNNIRNWSSYVDNEIIVPTDSFFTILPSNGFNKRSVVKSTTFNEEFENGFRIIIENEEINNPYNNKEFPGHNQYMRDIDNKLSIGSNNKKVFDLMGTFSPGILDQFEEIFLYFASQELNEQVPQVKFNNLSYGSFQSLISDIVKVKKFTFTDENDLYKKMLSGQQKKLEKITTNILSTENIIKITLGNPKELNSYVIEGFAGIAPSSTFSFNGYSPAQLTSDNIKLMNLYLGEFPDSGINYYEEFFSNMDVVLNEDNILYFRPLIYIYAGYRKQKGNDPGTISEFKEYIKTNIYKNIGTTVDPHGAERRLNLFLVTLLRNFSKLDVTVNSEVNIEFYGGYNDEGLKIELYNYFKSWNDKWASGNSVGQKLLMEEFLFLDKANRDIGDRGYINLDRIISLMDTKNANTSLYGALSILLQGSGFDMRALPAYVNFYGKSLSSKTKITPSSTVAENLFGTFLDVDYEDSEPKMVIQYVEGPLSKHNDITNNTYNKFNDDSFDMSDNNNNPIIITDPNAFTVESMLKSNRAVAFEVSFGDQNQGIFKGVTLDQNTIRNTTESFSVLENLARSESGAGVYNIDTSLFEYYRQASYACEVSCMGNMMIQPTMFFYLKNIPMFKGSFWITEVNHTLKNNTINTTFKGTRIPRSSLPDPIDTFVASFRPIMDKIIQKAVNTVKKEESALKTPTTEIIINGYATDPGLELVFGEQFITEAGITDYGLPYNGWGGEKYIQKVYYKGKNPENIWYRSRVVRMKITGEKEPNVLSDVYNMSILCDIDDAPVSIKGSDNPNIVTWKELKELRESHDFYTTKFNLTNTIGNSTKISKKKTLFLKPNNNADNIITINPQYNLIVDETNKLNVTGAVGVGPSESGYGIAMSTHLMKRLNVVDGDVVYFRLEDL